MMGPVYVITDRDTPRSMVEQVLAAARGGAAVVQIRDKRASDDDMITLIDSLLPALKQFGTKLIVNDRVQVALRTGAHGLHVGQGDGDPAAIRSLLRPGMILGLSVETLAQARAIPAGVDYIGAGPVRATASKPDHADPVGFDGLAQIVAASGLPAYAIGGLHPGDAQAVKRAGAIGLAVVSAVTRAPDPVAATAALVAEWGVA